MFHLENTRKNRNFLRLAALATVVLLVTMFGGPGSSDQPVDLPHSSAAASNGTKPVEFQHKATQTRSAGGQKVQLSLMIFRSN